jgi:predicted O-linked N-acetylglucosamine transferase (SPINDLY family)
VPQLTLQQAFDLAVAHHQSGRLQEAESIYRQILAHQPNHPDALNNLALILQHAQAHAEAVDLLRKAISIQPGNERTHTNLGNALAAMGQMDAAIAAQEAALRINPRFPEALQNLGSTFRDLGRNAEALNMYQRALTSRPDYLAAHFGAGTTLLAMGRTDEAIAALRAAVKLHPNDAKAHNSLGTALGLTGRFEEAIEQFRRVLAIDPKHAEALNNLGNVMTSAGKLDEALAALNQAIALKPENPEAYVNLGNLWKETGEPERATAAYQQAITFKPDFPDGQSNFLLSLEYHPGMDAHAIAAHQREWNRRQAKPLSASLPSFANDRSPERRLRIGYVSPDFKQHAITLFLLPLLENHDREAFEIFAYSQVLAPDHLTDRVRAQTHHWRSSVGLSDAQAAAIIRDDRIDILVDLALHTSGNRLLVFARKPAPVQATYLAYAGSSGLSTMDYRLSDPHLDPVTDPPGGDQSVYSEKTVRLPATYWCYQPLVDLPLSPRRAAQGAPITFGCLNNFCKVNAAVLELWARVLHAVPGSRLILHTQPGNHRAAVLERFARGGVDPSRINLVGRVSTHDYFQLYQQIDIALDTNPFGGGTTTCDALWMGVPVITLAGERAVGRGGVSILSNIGLPDLIANSPEHYVVLAATLAGDLARLSELRSSLRGRMRSSPLMDAPRFARDVEAAYRQMWLNWVAHAPR